MSAVEITPQGLSISQLRAEAARTADAKQARRILASPGSGMPAGPQAWRRWRRGTASSTASTHPGEAAVERSARAWANVIHFRLDD
jgi:hypothetical protein